MTQRNTKNSPASSEKVSIRDAADEGRFVLEVDGVRAGLADYRLREGNYFFVHTEVDSEFQGRGFGMSLARFALDDVRRQRTKAVPICPLFAAFVQRHPEYNDIIDHKVFERVLAARRRKRSESDE